MDTLPDHIKELVSQGENQFSKRMPLMSMWQEIADNFYVERADFIIVRNVGRDYAAHLKNSYPLLVSRDLGNTFSSMLRPRDRNWFSIKTNTEADEDPEARAYLEKRAEAMRRAIYDPISGFTRATKEGDKDFANFGQCVLSVEMNHRDNAPLYRCWHMRDVAWMEDFTGNVSHVWRKWKPAAIDLPKIFRNVSPKLDEKIKKDPFQGINCMNVVLPSADYGGKKFNQKWVSLWIDTDHNYVMEEVGQHIRGYVIPRWQTVSGSQYAVSPAAVCALPDARLLQAITLILLEAGEKTIDPPMIAQEGVVSSDVRMYSGGITFVNSEYDERLGEAIRPILTDKTGLQFGLEMKGQTEMALRSAFFLDKIDLPPSQMTREMTAFEASQRVQSYIRQALPLFEPVEQEYNGQLCEQTNTLLEVNGAFGNPRDNMPKQLSDREIHFVFRSPLTEGAEREKGQRLQEATAIIANSVALYPAAAGLINFKEALRDGLSGIGTPASWLNSDDEISAMAQKQAEAQQAQQVLGMMQQGADAAQKIGQASQSLQQGGMIGG